MSYGLAVDVGGTFTDVVLAETETGTYWAKKTPTTPDPTDGVLTGMRKIIERAAVPPGELKSLDYATTAAVNALLTRTGARVGLLTTDGFGQILHLARSQTPGPLVGWLNMIKPDPLADLEDTREIQERTRADGSIEVPLDEKQTRTAVADLAAQGVEAIAIGFLHSYANDRHERSAAQIAAEAAPSLPVTLSSEVHPEYREYERVVTTVANAFLIPTVSRYLADFGSRLRDEGWSCTIHVVRSDGGLMSTEAAARRPVSTIFSGPSGGVAGALAVARSAGLASVLTLDMGGTSTDVSVCIDGEAQVTRDTIVGDFPIRSPSVDVRSIGAGGGSIAHVPEVVRALRVGPQSAGADPGPACYGKGGTAPTVTDANLLLGRLPPALLGGEMTIDREAAERAIDELAHDLRLETLDAAQGIVDIINENMAGALRVMSVERGLDPRGFALVAFGGAGPLHANALAGLLGCFPVVIPPFPGVLSAFGFHTTGHRNAFTRTLIRRLGPETWTEVQAVITSLAAQARGWLATEAVSGEVTYSCDIRFLRQGYEIDVPFSASELEPQWPAIVSERFRKNHQRLYGFVADADVEVVNLRVEARAPSGFAPPRELERVPGDGEQALVAREPVYVGRRWQDAGVYERSLLRPGDRVRGPAVVSQADTTTLILPQHVAEVDGRLNLLIWPEGSE